MFKSWRGVALLAGYCIFSFFAAASAADPEITDFSFNEATQMICFSATFEYGEWNISITSSSTSTTFDPTFTTYQVTAIGTSYCWHITPGDAGADEIHILTIQISGVNGKASKAICLKVVKNRDYEAGQYVQESCSVPTLSEWGLILFSLLILSLATVVVTRRRLALAGGINVSTGISGRLFFPKLYGKALTMTLAMAVVALTGAFVLSEAVPTRDIVGTFLSAGIVAYIVHLWFAQRE